MSSDGFIAGENDNIDFLNPYQIEGEDYGYTDFLRTVGNIIVGRKTYEKVQSMGFPYHPDKPVFILTKQIRHSESDNHQFYQGSIASLIKQLKSSQNKHIYCDGGADVAKQMLAENLIDEIILSIVPVNLKKGTLLLEQGKIPPNFSLMKKQHYKTGLTQYHFEKSEPLR